MSKQPTIRNAMLVAALGAVTATAWAMSESLSSPPSVSSSDAPAVAPPAAEPAEPVPVTDVTAQEITPAPSENIAAPVTASPSENTVAPVNASTPKPAPVVPKEVAALPSAPQPPITVEERRLSEDQRIQAEVTDALANDPRLSGKIAVETRNAEVWLSGHTMTANQAWHAGRDAGRVTGVRYVHNEISFRVGRSL